MTERQSNSQPENQANQQASRGPNPYVGPRPFEPGETLYGREREVLELYDLLIAERIVLLHSPSGAGKTSLLQAALLPKLQDKRFRVLPIVRVNSAPLPATASANRYVMSTLLSLEKNAEKAEQRSLAELATLSLQDYLVQRGIIPRLRNPSGADPSHDDNDEMDQPTERQPDVQRTMLIFDQFEEILTIDATNRAAKTDFFAQLGAVLAQRHIWAIFALRDDYVAQLDPYLRPLPTRLQTRFRLDLLAVASAQAAIQKPARGADVTFTDAAARRLVTDLAIVREQTYGSAEVVEKAGIYIEPVQLQVVCQDLWEKPWAAPDMIDVGEIEAVGDVDSALATYYVNKVRAAATQTGITERTIRAWFTERLITGQNIRSQVLHGAEQGLATPAIDALVNAYLVRREERRGATWFELAHDRLVTPVQEANNAWFAANLSTLQRQAALWHKQNRPEGLLLRGEELTAAEQWAATQPTLEEAESDFLDESRTARTRAAREARQNQRIRWLAVGATLVALLALVAAAWGLTEQGNARQAEARAKAEAERAYVQANIAFTRQLLAQADQVYGENPLLGLRLALEADAHLTQPEPILRSQILSQTLDYLEQGKIATLATAATGFMDVPDTPWFIIKVNAQNGGDELRSKADGALALRLTGAVRRVYALGDTSSFFVVEYDGDTPRELRRKVDGVLAPGLTGAVRWVYALDDTSPSFVVEYDSDTPSELRNKADGALISTLTGPVRRVYALGDTSSFFVVEYDGDKSGELRSKADGTLVPGLTGSVLEVYGLDDKSPFFVVEYDGSTLGELRSKADGALVSTLTGPVDRGYTFSDKSSFFVVEYDGSMPGELRSRVDGALVGTLTGPVDGVYTFSNMFSFFVVKYDGSTPEELRSTVDGTLISTLAGVVRGFSIGPNIPSFFKLLYDGGTPAELRSTVDGTLVSTLAGPIQMAYGLSDTSPFFVVEYDGDTPGELRRRVDGALISTLAGPIQRAYALSDASPFFVVEYDGDMPSELRRKVDGALMPGLTGSVLEVYGLSDTSPVFVVEYDGDMPSELRRKVDGTLISTLTGAVDQVYGLSDTSPFFVVEYDGSTPGELRSKVDGALVSTLAGAVQRANGLSDTSPFFVVEYDGGTPGELRRKADGTLITDWVKTIDDQQYVFGYFFVERSDNRHTELWQMDSLQPLVDLGIGLPWTDYGLPDEAFVFDNIGQTLSIRYEDGRAYLLDLAWLTEIQARTTGEGAGNTAMPPTTCLPFALHPFEEALLQGPEYLGETPSLACPEPLRLVEQGRHAARQVDVTSASALFQAAVAQDPTLAIDPEAVTARLAAQSLARQGHLLLWQSKLDEAVNKLAEARRYDPTIAIDSKIKQFLVNQLAAGQTLLTAQQIVTATIRFDTLAMLEKTVGVGTLDQPTKVAVAQAYVTIGETLAQTGNITDATVAFTQALLLDPTQQMEPDTQARTIAAQALLERGSQLAREQKIPDAITAFQDALVLDSSLGVDVEFEAYRLAAAALVEQGQSLARWGDGQGALDKFAEAQALDPALTLDPVAEVTRLAPTPTPTVPPVFAWALPTPTATATSIPSPLATPTPVAASPLATPIVTVSSSSSVTPTPVAASPLVTPTATVASK